jgi:hypothetical protein
MRGKGVNREVYYRQPISSVASAGRPSRVTLASSGRSDALEALRVARGRDQAHTISASKTAAAPPLEAQVQVTKQGTVIQKFGERMRFAILAKV